jgi:hypothetical protein
MHLDAVAVVFDFVNPLLTLGSLALEGRKLRLNEPRHRNASYATHKIPRHSAEGWPRNDRAKFITSGGYQSPTINAAVVPNRCFASHLKLKLARGGARILIDDEMIAWTC